MIILASILMILNRIFEGIKSGAFYGKGKDIENKTLSRAIKNIHFVETPLWYFQYGAFFLLILWNNPTWLGALGAFLIVMGTSAAGSYHRQGFINVGSGEPFVDPNENPKMQFMDKFWISRPWYGKRRIYFALTGLVAVIIGILILSNA